MAFSGLGKLLEILEDIVREMDRTSVLPDGIISNRVYEIKKKIWELKQTEQFK